MDGENKTLIGWKFPIHLIVTNEINVKFKYDLIRILNIAS